MHQWEGGRGRRLSERREGGGEGGGGLYVGGTDMQKPLDRVTKK